MANNYLQFSEMLETKDPEERQWLVEQLGLVIEEDGVLYAVDVTPGVADQPWEGPRFLHGLEDFEDDHEDPGFSWTMCEDGLWIYVEESGDTSKAAVLAQAYLKKFHPKGIWKLEWAETCSKPRLNEFGGGAVVVTANRMHWMTSWDFTSKQISILIDIGGLKEHVSDPS